MPSNEPPSVTDWDCSTRGGPAAGTSARSVRCPSALATTPTDAFASSTTAGVYAEPSGNVAWMANGPAPGQAETSVGGPAGPRVAPAPTGRFGAGSHSSSAM